MPGMAGQVGTLLGSVIKKTNTLHLGFLVAVNLSSGKCCVASDSDVSGVVAVLEAVSWLHFTPDFKLGPAFRQSFPCTPRK
jgi:hypothetical protein